MARKSRNKIIAEVAKDQAATAGVRQDLRSGETPNPFRHKSVIFNENGNLDYDQIKQKIHEGYTPMSLTLFKKQVNGFYAALPNDMGKIAKDKLRLKQAGITAFADYEKAIKSGNPKNLGHLDDRNIAEKMLNLNPNQGFIQDVSEVLNRPLEAIKNSVYEIGQGEGKGNRFANFFTGFAQGLTGNADERTWEQAISSAVDEPIHLNKGLELAMDIMLDPLNIVPVTRRMKIKSQMNREVQLIAKNKALFKKLTNKARKSQDALNRGTITADTFNLELDNTLKIAAKKGVSSEALKAFKRNFSFHYATPEKLHGLKDELYGDTDEMTMAANNLFDTLDHAKPQDVKHARMFIETNGKNFHAMPLDVAVERLRELGEYGKTKKDALHLFGNAIPKQFHQQITTQLGARQGLQKEMVDLQKQINKIVKSGRLDGLLLSNEQMATLRAMQQRQLLLKNSMHHIDTGLERFTRTSLGHYRDFTTELKVHQAEQWDHMLNVLNQWKTKLPLNHPWKNAGSLVGNTPRALNVTDATKTRFALNRPQTKPPLLKSGRRTPRTLDRAIAPSPTDFGAILAPHATRMQGRIYQKQTNSIFGIVDFVNNTARRQDFIGKGQKILDIEMAQDLTGFKLYTNNTKVLGKILNSRSRKIKHGLAQLGSQVNIPIQAKYVRTQKDLSPGAQTIVDEYNYVKDYKTTFVKKHSDFFENKFRWNRYAGHHMTDEGKLAISAGGTDNIILGRPGYHAEQVSLKDFHHISQANVVAREQMALSHGFKNFEQFTQAAQKGIKQKVRQISGTFSQRNGFNSPSAHSRRIFGTIDETNDNFNSVGKFFKEDLQEIVMQEMTDMQRHVLPEAFFSRTNKAGYVKWVDDKNNLFEVSHQLNDQEKLTTTIKPSLTNLQANEGIYSLGMSHGGLGFSNDIAGTLAKKFGFSKVALNQQSAYLVQRMNNVGKSNVLNQLYSKYIALWKGSKLFSTGFHKRNFFGDVLGSYNAGLNPLNVMKNMGLYRNHKLAYLHVEQQLARGQKIGNLNHIKVAKYHDFHRFIKAGIRGEKGGGILANFQDSLKLLNSVQDQGVVGKTLKKMINYNFKVAGGLDSAARYSIFREAEKNPLIVKAFAGKNATARDMVEKIKFDYSKKTRFEGQFVDQVVPFWFWAKNNTLLMARSMLKNPNRVNHINNLISQSLAATGIGETQLPEYVKKQGYLSVEGLKNMLTGQQPSAAAALGNDSFLKWGSIVNAALNPLETLSGLSPLISAGQALLTGQGNAFAPNWDKVSQQYNHMRAVAGDIGINPQQAMAQMEMFNNPFAKIGIAAPRAFSVAQQLDPTPFQGWIKMLHSFGADVANNNVGGHSFFPSMIKHINPIEMKMTELYFSKKIIDNLKKHYTTITGTLLPSLFQFTPPKLVADTNDEFKNYYGHLFHDRDNHRMQQTLNEIIAEAENETP